MHQFVGLTGTRLQLQREGAPGSYWPADVVVESAAGSSSVTVKDTSTGAVALQHSLSQNSVWRAGETVILVAGSSSSNTQSTNDAQQQSAVVLQCSSQEQAQQLWQALQDAQQQPATDATAVRASQAQNGTGSSKEPSKAGNVFDAKTDKGSAELYFHYYGMLMHQQNMLQDMTRTGTYHAAITENRADFEGKLVMDVGAGSGILSLFAAQAGARKVYAVEASGMAKYAQQLASRNPVGKVIQVCHGKVEQLQLPSDERVDVLVSEPMGTLLVNERMLETYLYARDHFLKPGGKMFPQLGRIHCACFSDAVLHSELLAKAMFWQQNSFFGLDMTPLHQPALDGYFTQVVVDAFDPSVLVSDCATRVLDFATMKEEELLDITIPLDLTIAHPCTLHGVACWFDVLFNGSTSQRWLSTAPGLPTTHWFQLRCCMQQPLVVLVPNTKLTGTLRLVAHERQSYDVLVELHAPPVAPGMPPQLATGKFDLKEPYYRLTQWAQPVPQQQQPVLLPAVAVQQPVAGIPGVAPGAAAVAGTATAAGGVSSQPWAAGSQGPAQGVHAV